MELIKKNFNFVYLVNNSPDKNINHLAAKGVRVINNTSNLGLSIGINIGCTEAKKAKYDLVCLFDQDTKIDSHFNSTMIRNINLYSKSKKNALYSPICFNTITKNYLSLYFVYFLRLKRKQPDSKILIYYPDFVITSGSYIPLDVIEYIGLMDENLFINYIDFEWCLRARSKGYKIISFSNCEIEHNIGDYSLEIFKKRYSIHTPLRMYYTFRNALYVYSLKHINFSWKLIDFLRNILRAFFYLLFVQNRKTYLKYIIKGYYHGLIKKMGKLEE